MDEYQVRTWQGWHHHIALSLIAVWFLIDETHRGQQFTPALTLPQALNLSQFVEGQSWGA
jgi:SRSO17 transposase